MNLGGPNIQTIADGVCIFNQNFTLKTSLSCTHFISAEGKMHLILQSVIFLCFAVKLNLWLCEL